MIDFSTRTAWCARCDGPQQVDDRGCLTCRALMHKARVWRNGYAKYRRELLAREGVCINAISHGPPEPGKTKCTACLEVHRRSNRRQS